MAKVLLYDLDENLAVHAKSAVVSEWRGSKALRIENGLVVLPDLNLKCGSVEVEVGVDQAAYPGIAFHIADPANFELLYSRPHTSGNWDALQYDPVFQSSNTWQIHHGPRFQKEASVPIGRWYSLRLDFGDNAASVSVNGQPPLIVNGLAHRHKSGAVGLWTFRSAFFRNLRIYSGKALPEASTKTTSCTSQLVTKWFLDGTGIVEAEPHGLVLLNRFLPSQVTQATLTRGFNLAREARVEFKYGFSDVFSLSIDGVTIFSGSNTFSGLSDRDARGYAEPNAHTMAWDLKAGPHMMKVVVGVKEPFGWGFGLSAAGASLTLLPPCMP